MDEPLVTGTAGQVERQELAREVRRFLERHASLAHNRKRIPEDLLAGSSTGEVGYDEAVWQRLVDDFDAPGIQVPERFGGQGYGFAELAVLLVESGRVLLPSPLLSSAVLATTLLLELADETGRDELLAQLATGERTATLALVEPGSGWNPGSVTMLAEPDGADVLLSGEKIVVLDGQADVVLAAARRPGTSGETGLLVVAVPQGQDGLEVRGTASLDPTRPLHALRFKSVRGRPLGHPTGSAADALRTALTLATVALAAEMVGGARRSVEVAVDYAKTRAQFGRLIGSFQAIKHRCADMLAEVELADAIVSEAASAAAADATGARGLASMAKLQASRAYLYAALEGLHVHGGIGFTWEHDAQLFVRRAKASDVLFGNQQFHRRVVAEHLGLAHPTTVAARGRGR